MKASKGISLVGTALVVLSAGTLMAQEAGTRDSGRDQGQQDNVRERAAQGNNAAGNAAQGAEGQRAGHETRMLIGHAVSMAISGTTLKGQAEQAGRMDTPGQSGSQDNRGQAGAQGSQAQAGAQGGQAQAGAGGDPSQQLMTHARKGMQESRRLLQAAGRDQASAQQLYRAADGYINTLLTLCGESSTQDAGAARAENAAGDTGRARTGRSSRDEDLGAGQAGRQGRTLSARDKAAVALINHSVCEVIEGTRMTHMLQSQAAGNSAAGELLQRHAREMTTEGRETLQRFLGSSRTGSGGAANADGDAGRNAARSDNAGARAEGDKTRADGDAARAAGGQAGDVSVTTLAQRGQELIEAFQGGAQGGTGRPGGSRLDGDRDSSGADRSKGAGRSSDAENKNNPR